MKTTRLAAAAALLLSLSPVFTGCASKQIVSESVARTRLFPNGVYRHKVRLTIASHGDVPEKKFDFDGVVRISDDAIRVVVLSFFGTTLVKINDDLKKGEVTSEVFIEPMKKFEPKLREYYSVLKLVLISPATHAGESANTPVVWNKVNEKGLPLELKTTADSKDVEFLFNSYDKSDIPESVLVKHPSFTADIQVTGYEL